MMADILKSGHEEQLHPVHAGGGLSRLHGTAAAVLAALGAVDVVVLLTIGAALRSTDQTMRGGVVDDCEVDMGEHGAHEA